MAPGDVLVVEAVGIESLAEDSPIRLLKNVVVLPAHEKAIRSLTSALGCDKYDGRPFKIITEPALIPKQKDTFEAARSTVVPEPPSTISPDRFDFISDFVTSDVTDLLADQHLVAAHLEGEGTKSALCRKISSLHSIAVTGAKVNISEIRVRDMKPDFLRSPSQAYFDEYGLQSSKPRTVNSHGGALARIFREVPLRKVTFTAMDQPALLSPHLIELPKTVAWENSSVNTISRALRRKYADLLADRPTPIGILSESVICNLQSYFSSELHRISFAATISRTGLPLCEEEIVLGRLINPYRGRRDEISATKRLRSHTKHLCDFVRLAILGPSEQRSLESCVKRSWLAWTVAHRIPVHFGAGSFCLLVLGILLEHLEQVAFTPEAPTPKSKGKRK